MKVSALDRSSEEVEEVYTPEYAAMHGMSRPSFSPTKDADDVDWGGFKAAEIKKELNRARERAAQAVREKDALQMENESLQDKLSTTESFMDIYKKGVDFQKERNSDITRQKKQREYGLAATTILSLILLEMVVKKEKSFFEGVIRSLKKITCHGYEKIKQKLTRQPMTQSSDTMRVPEHSGEKKEDI